MMVDLYSWTRRNESILVMRVGTIICWTCALLLLLRNWLIGFNYGRIILTISNLLLAVICTRLIWRYRDERLTPLRTAVETACGIQSFACEGCNGYKLPKRNRVLAYWIQDGVECSGELRIEGTRVGLSKDGYLREIMQPREVTENAIEADTSR